MVKTHSFGVTSGLIIAPLFQLGFFVYYSALAAATSDLPSVTSATSATSSLTSELTSVVGLGSVPLDSALVYRPDRSWELWRLVTYMVLHTR